MSIGSLILALAFLVGVVAIVVWPLITAADKPKRETVSMASASLSVQYEAVLMNLRDLDFDFQTGKLSEADYQTQRERFLQQGERLLRQLDVQGELPAQSPPQFQKAKR